LSPLDRDTPHNQERDGAPRVEANVSTYRGSFNASPYSLAGARLCLHNTSMHLILLKQPEGTRRDCIRDRILLDRYRVIIIRKNSLHSNSFRGSSITIAAGKSNLLD